jgi:hypothetical protein
MASDDNDSLSVEGARKGPASSGAVSPPVKDPSDATSRRDTPRWLEGWQWIPLLVLPAWLAVLLVVPRPVPPSGLPLPAVDRTEERRARRAENELARRAEERPLAFETREVGEALRRYGRLETAGAGLGLGLALADLRRFARAVEQGPLAPELAALLAYQAWAFRNALSRWPSDPEAKQEVEELGGSFLKQAQKQGWLVTEQRTALTASELTILFRLRWLSLTGLERNADLRLSLNDYRVYYAMLLRLSQSNPELGPAARLRLVVALSEKDPKYPGLLARGLLELESGRPAQASRLLREFLLQEPRGPWQLRARNLLTTSLSLEGE